MQPVPPDELPIKQACVRSTDNSNTYVEESYSWNPICYDYFYKLCVHGTSLKFYKMLYIFNYP